MATNEQIAELANAANVTTKHVAKLLRAGATIDELRRRWGPEPPLPVLSCDDMDPSACRALWLAVIYQAFLDYKRDKEGLMRWANSSHFPALCSMAGLDADWTRKQLERKQWNGRKCYVFWTKREDKT